MMPKYISFKLSDGYVLRLNNCVQKGEPAIGISVTEREDKAGYINDVCGTSIPLKDFVKEMKKLVEE